MTFPLKSLMTLFFIFVFCFVIYDTWDLEFAARLFPFSVSAVALVLLVWQLSLDLKPQKHDPNFDSGMDLAFSEEESTPEGRWRTLEMFAWIFGMAGLLWLIGFFITIPLVIFLYLLRHREGIMTTIAVPAVTGLLVWVMFNQLATLPFPPGALFEWLGWA